MASKSDRDEYYEALSELANANARPEWPQVRKAARDRAETALVNQFLGRSGRKSGDKS
jgi:hypothetical protein